LIPARSRPLREVFAALPIPGRVAIGGGAIAALVLGVSLYHAADVVVGPSPDISDAPDPRRQAEQYAAAFDQHLAQIEGRSLFFVPGAPEAPPVRVETPTDSGPKAPPAPSSYGGPAVTAMIFDTVWFADGRQVKVGDAPQNDLAVVSVNPPWDAVLSWRGVEFTVTLFEQDRIVKATEVKPAATPAPAEPTPEPADSTAQAPPEPPEDSEPSSPPSPPQTEDTTEDTTKATNKNETDHASPQDSARAGTATQETTR
jgi:hypothetical protein